MRNPNGQSAPQNSSSENAPVNARQVLGNSKSLSSAQAEFLSRVMFHGVRDLFSSLKLVHDIALYHSDYPLEEVERPCTMWKVYGKRWRRWDRVPKIQGRVVDFSPPLKLIQIL